MTTTYTGNPEDSPKDAVRFLLSDTKDPWKFSDEEITYALSLYNDNVFNGAAELANIMASKYTDRRDKTVGPLSIKYGDLSSRWDNLARSLRQRGKARGGARAIMTQRVRGPHFKIGMHDIYRVRKELDDLLGEEPLYYQDETL
jgi:hypothetical protein